MNETVDSRFSRGRLVGEGAFSQVFRATELATRAERALKLFRSTLPLEARLRIRKEAAVLATLKHPNIVEFLEFNEAGATPFIVTEFVDAPALDATIGQGVRLTIAEVIDITAQIARALSVVHQRGLVHGDLKPANVLVSRSGQKPVVKLIDFGLADAFRGSAAEALTGTVAYFAPEQTGLVDGRLDGRADLYSLGVMVFEMLTGRHPFVLDSVASLLRQHAYQAAVRVDSLREDVPRVLVRVVEKLLQKDPGARYQAADGLALDLERLGTAPSLDALAELPLDDYSYRRQPRFAVRYAGRAAELETVRGALAASGGSKGLGLIGGPSGVGKTRFVEEYLRRHAPAETLVLTGKCFRGGNTIAYQPINEAFDASLAQADRAALRTKLGPLWSAATDVFPRLRGDDVVRSSTAQDAGTKAALERRAIMAVWEFLRSGRPSVLVIDDLQWADDLSCRFLEQRSNAPADGTTLMALMRSDELEAGSRAERLYVGTEAPACRVELGHLADDAVKEIIADALMVPMPSLPEQIAALITSKSGGSPLFALELVRRLFVEGALTEVDGAWRVDTARAATVQLQASLVDLLAHRITQLDAPTRSLLELMAIAGRALNLEALTELSGRPADELFDALQRAVRAYICRERGEGYGFEHDKVQEAVSRTIEPAAARALHARVATFLLEGKHRPTADVTLELATHFFEAKDQARGRLWLLKAGELALSQGAAQAALTSVERVEALFEGAPPAEVARAARWLEARAKIARGHYDEAGALLRGLLETAEDKRQRQECRSLLTKIAIHVGDMTEAEQALIATLRELDFKVPRSIVAVVLTNTWLTVKLLFFGWLSRPVDTASDDARRLKEIVWRLLDGAYLWYYNSPLRSLFCVLSASAVARRIPTSTREVVAADAYLSTVLGILGFRRLRRPIGQRAAKAAEASGDLWSISLARLFLHIGAFSVAEWDDEMTRLGLESMPRWKEFEDHQMEIYNANCSMEVLFWRGDLPEYFELVKRYEGRGENIKSAWAFKSNREALGHLLAGRPIDYERCIDRAGTLAQRFRVWSEVATNAQHRGEAALWTGDWRAALPKLKNGLFVALRRITIQPYMAIKGLSSIAEAAFLGLSDAGASAAERRALGRTLRRFGRWTVLAAELAPGFKGLRTRYLGLVAATGGQRARALELFARSIDELIAGRSRVEVIRGRLVLARYARSVGDSAVAARQVEQAWKESVPLKAKLFLRQCVDEARALKDSNPPAEAASALDQIAAALIDQQVGDLISSREELTSARTRLAKLGLEGTLAPGQVGAPLSSQLGASRLGQTLTAFNPRVSVVAQALVDRHETDALAALVQVGQVLSTTLNFEEVLQRLNECVSELLHVERSAVVGYDEAAGYSVLSARGFQTGTDPSQAGMSLTVLDQVRSSRQPLVVQDAARDARLATQSVLSSEVRTICCAPLMARGRLLGLVYADNPAKAVSTLGERERDLLEVLASQATVALESSRAATLEANSKALERDLALTAAVQSLMLPSRAHVPGAIVKVSGHYEPATTCGGDWWWHEFAPSGGGRLLLGDATGHGPPAAMLTAAVSTAYRLFASSSADQRSQTLLKWLDTTLVDICKGAYAMTMCALDVDEKARELVWHTAGAPPALVLSSTGELEVLQAEGAPLGSGGFRAGSARRPLRQGERVLMFTDGVSELALPNGKALGLRQLRKAFVATQGRSHEEAFAMLERELASVRGEVALQDDLTFIVVDVV